VGGGLAPDSAVYGRRNVEKGRRRVVSNMWRRLGIEQPK
jgi:hypothetical protein